MSEERLTKLIESINRMARRMGAVFVPDAKKIAVYRDSVTLPAMAEEK